MRTFLALALACLFLASPAQAQSDTVIESIYMQAPTRFQVLSSSADLVKAEDFRRSFVELENRGTVGIQFKFGSRPTSATDGFLLAPGTRYNPGVGVVNAIYALAVSGTQDLVILTGRGPRSKR